MTREKLRDELWRLHLEAMDVDVDLAATLAVLVRMMIANQSLAPRADAALMVEYRALERDRRAELLGRIDQTIEMLETSE
jgi:hypothetical protein